jgi:hypothetical protein
VRLGFLGFLFRLPHRHFRLGPPRRLFRQTQDFLQHLGYQRFHLIQRFHLYHLDHLLR